MKRWPSYLLGAALLALLGCEGRQVVLVPGLDGALPPGVDPIPPAPDGLLGVRIDPGSVSLLDTQAPPATTTFRAIGQFEDREEDLSRAVAWRISAPELGTLEFGVFTASGQAGTTQIEALIGSSSAVATVSIQVDRVWVAPGLPPSIVARFPEDPSSDPEDGPTILYPASEVGFPANMPSPRLQWEAHAGAVAYELRFESSAGTLRMFTAATDLVPDASAWKAWLGAHRGRGFSFSIRAATDTTVHRSARHRIEVSGASIEGSAYFWSTQAAGILRANLSDPVAMRYFPVTPPPPRPDAGFDDAGEPIEVDDKTGCASCHVVSRDGRRMALGFEGERLLILNMEGPAPVPIGPSRSEEFGFGVFSPDSTRLAFTNDGRLRMMDLSTFQVTRLSFPGDERSISHPDWSPDGRSLVVAYSEEDEEKNKEIEHETHLARIPVSADGTVGVPEIIVASTGGDDVLHSPSYSPDGSWVAYVRSRGQSKDNDRSVLWLVRSDGRGEPIPLTRLNRNVGPGVDTSDLGNSMPTWVRGEAGQDWLVFSSRRAYGHLLERDRRDQLWVSSIDLDRATEGLDPSAPAFWLPFQSIDADNHRAFFTGH